MIGWVSRSRRRGSAGFTLIELLVVIVILGILAAVVVFAVRGSRDKGRGAAIATDERIIRTAMEVYCAQKGHYPAGPDPMQTLVNEKFLSSLSTYHSLSTGDAIADYPQGKCADTPTHYKLEGPGNGNGGSTGNGTCSDPPATWRSGLFCPTGSRTGGATDSQLRSPLQLPDGRVMAILHPAPAFVDLQYNDCGSLRIELYAPNTGNWTTGPEGHCVTAAVATGDFTGGHVSMALISAAAGPCGTNCGKVLIYTDNSYSTNFERWYLYDPTVPAGQVGTALKEITPPDRGGHGPPTNYGELSLFQIAGPNCGAHCGEILIAGAQPDALQAASNNPPPPPYRIFDPKNPASLNAFQTVSRSPFPTTQFAPVLVGLADGKILAVGEANDNNAFHAMAEVINPSDLSIAPAAPPAHQYFYTTLEATGTRLATNEVLVTGYVVDQSYGNVDTADIFDPVTGTWRTAPKCPPLPNPGEGCFALTAVGNKVLAKTAPKEFYSQFSLGKMYLFGPGSKGSSGTWAKRTEAPDVPLGWAVPLQGSGCNPYCGKVLVVGEAGQPAYLFTP